MGQALFTQRHSPLEDGEGMRGQCQEFNLVQSGGDRQRGSKGPEGVVHSRLWIHLPPGALTRKRGQGKPAAERLTRGSAPGQSVLLDQVYPEWGLISSGRSSPLKTIKKKIYLETWADSQPAKAWQTCGAFSLSSELSSVASGLLLDCTG